MVDERIRIEIGFDGGQVMGSIVSEQAADDLDRALNGNGDGSFAFDAEDGRYTITVRRVVYVKRFTREARVGFTPA